MWCLHQAVKTQDCITLLSTLITRLLPHGPGWLLELQPWHQICILASWKEGVTKRAILHPHEEATWRFGGCISLWLKLGHLITPNAGEARECRLVAECQWTSLNVQFLLLQKRQEDIGRSIADPDTSAGYSTVHTKIWVGRTWIKVGSVDVSYLSHHGQNQKICWRNSY